MYKTIEEVKTAIAKVIKKHGYKNIQFVIVQNKMTKNAKPDGFNFRCLSNEFFNLFTYSEWRQEDDGSWSRMIEVVTA